VIKVESAGAGGGNMAKITVNGVEYSSPSRELRIVVINFKTGAVERSEKFDTHLSPGTLSLESFIDNFKSDGQIIAAACKDECSHRMSTKVKSWFKAMGST
jgi:hypothetical protein